MERGEDEGVDVRSTEAYRYELPPELIAQVPAEPRDAARLLHLRADGSLADGVFSDFPRLLRPGDVLVLNETRVIKARLIGTRANGGGAAEILLLRPTDRERYDGTARTFEALVRPGRRLRAGARVRFGDVAVAEILSVAPGGVRTVRFECDGSLDTVLERFGRMPLPPYVGRGDAARDARYQTIFGRVPGSVAAPTASLHFTEATFAALAERGVEVVPLVLDVGLGTFKPIETGSIDAHHMHSEHYEIPAETAHAIAAARRTGRRVIAAGTTALRALESAAEEGGVRAGRGETNLFITPGFAFRIADALLTNFHLPASTLLVLVSAFAGYERTRAAYAHAIAERYRFYSFGDAIFIEPQAFVRPSYLPHVEPLC
jgi:S-adenosylmethionine:tRNA ribosyltransferase-isomerase